MANGLSIAVKIKNALKIKGGVERISAVVKEEFSGFNSEKAKSFIDIISEYPPITRGNMPPPPYWSRGRGRVVNKAGMISVPSEHLTESWQIQEFVAPFRSRTTISNPASYAALVVGDDDHKDSQGYSQTWFHAENGWLTINEVLNAVGLRTGPRNEPAARALKDRIVAKITNVFK